MQKKYKLNTNLLSKSISHKKSSHSPGKKTGKTTITSKTGKTGKTANHSVYPLIMKNELISGRQQAYLQKPLIPWTKNLNIEISRLLSQKQKSFEKLAYFYDQAIFIFIAMDKIFHAKEICYSHIQTFIQYHEKFPQLNLLKYIFKPWIHLIQIDRKDKNIDDAYEKINAINIENLKSKIHENRFLKQMLFQSLNEDNEIKSKIISEFMVEKIKIYLMSGEYKMLSSFIEDNKIYIEDKYDNLVKEAYVIACVHLGEIKKVFNLFNFYKKNNKCYDSSILKLLELDIMMNDINKDILYKKMLILSCSMRSKELTIDQIHYSLYLSHLMIRLDNDHDVIPLLQHCLDCAYNHNDEVLIADTLAMLVSAKSYTPCY